MKNQSYRRLLGLYPALYEYLGVSLSCKGVILLFCYDKTSQESDPSRTQHNLLQQVQSKYQGIITLRVGRRAHHDSKPDVTHQTHGHT